MIWVYIPETNFNNGFMERRGMIILVLSFTGVVFYFLYYNDKDVNMISIRLLLN